ncbi:MAG: GntR family transcriptional regulator [Betaproteobacteria bacterium]
MVAVGGNGLYDQRMVSLQKNSSSSLSPLQLRVVRDILAFARRENLRAGDHLVESALADQIGTSRSPVNVALRHLVGEGVLTHDLHRGYFLNHDACLLNDLAGQFSALPDDPLYLRIVEDRLAQRLPDVVNEVDLMRRYDVSRSSLRKVLARIQKEEWIDKSMGHGWIFQAMIDSSAAYQESYAFRLAIEPAGLLSERFQVDPAEFAVLLQQQQMIADSGFETMTAVELFEANSFFHETLAKWSGNRFIFQGLRRTDRLRRLVEYRHASTVREPRRIQALEHLVILEAITEKKQKKAARLMHSHLEGAYRKKALSSDSFSGWFAANSGGPKQQGDQ